MKDPVKYSDHLFRRLTNKNDSNQDNNPAVCTEDGEEELLSQLRDPEYIDSQIKEMDRFNTSRAWRHVAQVSNIQQITPPDYKKRNRHWLAWTSAAAIIALLISLAAYLYNDPMRITPPDISEEISQAMARCEQSGLSGAVIEKGNNMAKSLSGNTGRQKTSTTPDTRVKDNDVVADMLNATKVTTYYDKEFWLTLPDGSIVHLASNTRLIYPEKFSDGSRDVYLEGEAYFIVAKSEACRFTVHTAAATTTVYGTEFNVSAPAGADSCEVVLVKGSVGVATPHGETGMLRPGEGAEINGRDITVSDVDITPYEAWNTGRIDFSSWPLGKIMAVIGKWYGMKVTFSDEEYSHVEISGSFNRYDSLAPTIESIEVITGLRITASSGIITVSK